MKRGKRREARGKKKNMKKRITLWLLATLFLANVSLADAQQPEKIPRIGILEYRRPSDRAPAWEACRQRLRDLGYIEGKNIIVEYRYAEGNIQRLSELAAELV